MGLKPLGAAAVPVSACESAQGSGSCRNRQHCIERNYKKLVDRGSPSAPIGTPAAADSVIRHKDLLTLLQEVYFDADSHPLQSAQLQNLALAYLRLADQADKNAATAIVYEPPLT